MTREFIDFVAQHADDDTARLLLAASRYPDIDMPLAVQQIEGLRTAKLKWPTLARCAHYLFPPRLAREQSSSEAAAHLKAHIATTSLGHTPHRVADLTGGMGVDAWAMSQVAKHVDYVERDASLVDLATRNFAALHANNIACHHADSIEWIATQQPFDLIVIDPARRDPHGRKVAAFEQCEPNLLQHMPLLRAHCRMLLVKASPMIDIALAISQLGNVRQVHIVGMQGECKEVLFLCADGQGEALLHVDIDGQEVLRFSHTDEEAARRTAPNLPANGWPQGQLPRYLYEPHPALMKAQPFALLATQWQMPQLSSSTHLYASNTLHSDFPGRILEVLSEVKLTPKGIAAALPDRRADLLCRNYPVAAPQLTRQLRLRSNPDCVLVATTLGNRPTGLLCRRPTTP